MNIVGEYVKSYTGSAELNLDKEQWDRFYIIEDLEGHERLWRNTELDNTDSKSLILDHSNYSNLVTYRQALRDWTDTENFPLIRPTL